MTARVMAHTRPSQDSGAKLNIYFLKNISAASYAHLLSQLSSEQMEAK